MNFLQKSIVLICIALLAMPIIAGTTVPEKVKKAFSSKYADAKDVKWEKESGSEYEAEFKMNGKDMSASFDNNGKWLETETKIELKDLPAAVNAAIAESYKVFTVKSAEMLESAKFGKAYEVDLVKGSKKIEIAINEKLEILKKNQKKVDDEEKQDDD
ncbi:MAG: hypothetical protein QG635_410 [Bacteroidota bacterium]|nr:hypothetical protein [Bacteroidota bacterium]